MEELQSLAKQWHNELLFARSLSPATADSYASDFADFTAFLTQYHGRPLTLQDVLALTPQDWRAWMSNQKQKGRDARTIARRLSALKSFFKFLVQHHYLKDHAIFSAKTPKLPKSLPHPADYDCIMALIDGCVLLPGEAWVHQRDKALILLLYNCGLRISEALSIQYADWKQTTNFLTIQGKGGKVRSVPLLENVKKEIDAYCAMCPFSDAHVLFWGEKGAPLSRFVVEGRMRKLRRMLNLPETFSPHALRHSCATDLIKESNDLRGVQELLGHASLSTTQIYTDIDNQYIQSVYAKAHPRTKK